MEIRTGQEFVDLKSYEADPRFQVIEQKFRGIERPTLKAVKEELLGLIGENPSA